MRHVVNRIVETFGKERVLLPVVHCISEAQVRAAVDLAREHADGVFLINHGGMPVQDLVKLAMQFASGGLPVGVNLLGFSLDLVKHYATSRQLAMVWTDDAACGPAVSGPPVLHFGGVAFKYRSPVAPERYGDVALEAARAGVDVVTTSGSATGSAPPVEKVAAMREALGDHALALASGVTPENVAGFLPFVNAFLVATGIESSFGAFDPIRIAELSAAIHGQEGSS